ncbi:MAG: hypothetical protein R3B54_14370 [Bdellovibrionota bacterium]
MKSVSALNLLVVAVLLALAGCGEPGPGEMRGRLGGNGSGGSSTLNQFRLVAPPNYRPRAGSARFNPEVLKSQIDRRMKMGEFNKDNLPTLASLREIRGPKNVTLSFPDGRVLKASGMCLMADGEVKDGSDLSLSDGPCPGDDEAVRNSELPLKVKALTTGRPSTILFFEITLNGVAIGRFSSTATFAKHPNGTYFPQGAKRHWLLDLCNTREIQANDPSGLKTKDYEKACIDAGLLS